MTRSDVRRDGAVLPLWSTAVTFGLAGGVIELLVVLLHRLWSGAIPLVDPHSVWMTPLMMLILSLGLAALFFVPRSLWPGQTIGALAVFSLAWLALLGPMFRVPRLHWIAAAVLAAGLATQITAFARKRAGVYAGRAWYIAGILVLIVLALTSADWAIRSNARRQQLAQLPEPSAGAPNVVLIVLDTVRARNLSLYGYERQTTPVLESLARRGVLFRSAVATAPWTLPSHGSMFTGRWPNELSVGWTQALDAQFPTLAEVLKSEGYTTAGFMANLIYGTTRHGLNRGFIDYHDLPASAGQTVMSSSLGMLLGTNHKIRMLLNYYWVLNRDTAGDITDLFDGWLSNHKDSRPFFAYLNNMDAHEPYLTPDPIYEKFGPTKLRHQFDFTSVDAFRPSKWTMSEEDRRLEIAAYDAAVTYMDQQIGRVVNALESRGILDNTVLIITSDHGEHFGEHRLYGHGNSLYREVLEVPLLISFGSRIPEGMAVEEPVSLRDIPATVMVLTGSKNTTVFPGISLTRFWNAELRSSAPAALISQAGKRTFGVAQPWYPLHSGNMRSAISEGYHYINNDNGTEELYNWSEDPEERDNLAQFPEMADVMKKLRKAVRDAE